MVFVDNRGWEIADLFLLLFIPGSQIGESMKLLWRIDCLKMLLNKLLQLFGASIDQLNGLVFPHVFCEEFSKLLAAKSATNLRPKFVQDFTG